jgi:hypothetical protein
VEGEIGTLRLRVSKRAAFAAATLVVLHFIAAAYVQATGMLYDQGDLEGLLWWLVVFWVLPVIALITLVLSLAKHRRNRNGSGN